MQQMRPIAATVRLAAELIVYASALALTAVALVNDHAWIVWALRICLPVFALSAIFLELTDPWQPPIDAPSAEIRLSPQIRRRLAALLQVGFWTFLLGVWALWLLGQARSAAGIVLMTACVALLVPSMRRRRLCSITSWNELAGELIGIVALTLGWFFLVILL